MNTIKEHVLLTMVCIDVHILLQAGEMNHEMDGRSHH